MTPPLYALTIWPEWLYAICELGKDVELRRWPIWPRLVGHDIVLHGGVYPGGSGPKAEGRANIRHFIRRVHEITGQMPPPGWTSALGAYSGKLAAVATPGAPTLASPSAWADPDGDVFSWPLANVRRLVEPLPCRGAQGLWIVPSSLATQIRAQLAGIEYEQ